MGQASESLGLDQRLSTLLRWNDIQLVPYVEADGAWTLPDEVLLNIAAQAQEEGTFKTVFFDGRVRTPADFLKAMKSPRNMPIFAFYGDDFLGFAWLNSLADNYGFAHFCGMRVSYGDLAVRVGEMVVDYWMAFPSLEILLGVTPGNNPLALRFIGKLGFQRIGEIPGMIMDVYEGERASAVISYYSRL